jgi:AraC-like DNA-binding protein
MGVFVRYNGPRAMRPSASIYRELAPGHLSEHVSLLWYFEGPTACRHKRIFPNGKVELLITLGEGYRTVGEGEDGWIPEVCATGLRSAPLIVEQPAWQRVMGVRLRPVGALALLATPMGELTGRIVDLERLVGHAARDLAGRCREATEPAECLRIAQGWLEARLAGSPVATAEVAWAARHIERVGGAVATEALRRQVGYSKARWATAFQGQIGLRPKVYSRVVRLSRLLDTFRRGETHLAAAAAGGFYDQPHMTTELRRLTGLTPRELLARLHPVGDGSTAAEPRPA